MSPRRPEAEVWALLCSTSMRPSFDGEGHHLLDVAGVEDVGLDELGFAAGGADLVATRMPPSTLTSATITAAPSRA